MTTAENAQRNAHGWLAILLVVAMAVMMMPGIGMVLETPHAYEKHGEEAEHARDVNCAGDSGGNYICWPKGPFGEPVKDVSQIRVLRIQHAGDGLYAFTTLMAKNGILQEKSSFEVDQEYVDSQLQDCEPLTSELLRRLLTLSTR